MYKSRLFVRGYGFMGQMGIRNEYYLKDWTPIEEFDNIPISDIKSNLGQTFILTQQNDLYYFGWPFDSNNIVKTYKTLNPPDLVKYFLLKNPFVGKYFFLDQHIWPRKLKLPSKIKIKEIASSNGLIYILDRKGDVFGMGDNKRGQLGQECEDNRKFVLINGRNNITQISAGLQHLLMLDGDGQLSGCGASNYCQLPTRDRNLKEISQVRIFNELEKFVKVSTGNFHSLFLEKDRKKIFGVGQNFKMQCGMNLETAEILEAPQEVFDLEKFSFDEEEVIVDIKSGSSHNFYVTNKRVIFTGNNEKNQLPFELGNKFEPAGVFAQEIKFDHFNQTDIFDLQPNFDRTGITFNNGSALLFGGIDLNEDKTKDVKDLEIIDNIKGFDIKKIVPGLQWEFAYCENKNNLKDSQIVN